jgi:hypothetical protein
MMRHIEVAAVDGGRGCIRNLNGRRERRPWAELKVLGLAAYPNAALFPQGDQRFESVFLHWRVCLTGRHPHCGHLPNSKGPKPRAPISSTAP